MSNTLILDFGNAFLKSISTESKEPIVIASCIHKLTPAQLKEKLKFDALSPLIAYNGEHYYVGVNAQLYSGINNWSADKLANIPLGLLASVDRSQRVDRLVVCVPDSSIDIDLSNLVGLHSYERNRQQIQLEVVEVEVIDETYGIWLGARSLLHHPNDNNVALTIGAGTVNLTLYSGEGQPLHRAVGAMGMSSIAADVSSALKSKHNLAATPKLASIMQGMAAQVYRLKGSDIDFTHELAEAIDRWKQLLRAFAIDNSQTGLEYWQFAIGGAGASYLPSTQSAIVVPNPQTFAIESLLSAYENQP